MYVYVYRIDSERLNFKLHTRSRNRPSSNKDEPTSDGFFAREASVENVFLARSVSGRAAVA